MTLLLRLKAQLPQHLYTAVTEVSQKCIASGQGCSDNPATGLQQPEVWECFVGLSGRGSKQNSLNSLQCKNHLCGG